MMKGLVKILLVLFMVLGICTSSETIELSPLVKGYAQYMSGQHKCTIEGIVLFIDQSGFIPSLDVAKYSSVIIEKNTTHTLMSILSHAPLTAAEIDGSIKVTWTGPVGSSSSVIPVVCEVTPAPTFYLGGSVYWTNPGSLTSVYPTYYFNITNYNKTPPPIAGRFMPMNKGADIRMLSNNIFLIHLVSIPDSITGSISVEISFDNFVTKYSFTIFTPITPNAELGNYMYSGNVYPNDGNNYTYSPWAYVFNNFKLTKEQSTFYALLKILNAVQMQPIKVLGNSTDFTLFNLVDCKNYPNYDLTVYQPPLSGNPNNLVFPLNINYIEKPNFVLGVRSVSVYPGFFKVMYLGTDNRYDLGVNIGIGAYSMDFVQSYPYGYQSVLASTITFDKYLQFPVNEYFSGVVKTVDTNSNVPNSPPMTIDSLPPKVSIIGFEKVTGNTIYYIFKARITDNLSGFSFIQNIGDYTNLVSGSILDGVYEFLFDPFFIGTSTQVCDFAYNCYAFKFYDYVNLDLLAFPRKTFDLSTITNVEFKMNNIDTSMSSVENSLYIYSTKVDRDFHPKIVTQRTVFQPENIYGSYDESKGCYVIPFTMKKNSIAGVFEYSIYVNYNVFVQGSILAQMFGPKAELRINKSNYGDVFGPMITNVHSRNPLVSVTQNTHIGWNITIEDKVNGFKYGYISFMSDIDLFKYNYTFDASNRLTGDKYLAIYQFAIPIDYRCVSQVFSIFEVYLEDEMGHTSVYRVDRPNTNIAFNPTMYFSNITETSKVTTNCNANGLDRTTTPAPELSSFTYSPLTINAFSANPFDRQIAFFFMVNSPTGILLESLPVVYLQESRLDKLVSSKSTLLTFNSTHASYYAVVNVPYGFGGGYKLHTSLFGVINNHGVAVGFDSVRLTALGYKSFIFTTVQLPTKISITGTSEATYKGGELLVFGLNFESGDQLYVQGVDSLFLTPSYSKSSVMMVTLPPTTLESIVITAIRKTPVYTMSNNITVSISQPYKPLANCLNGCSGGGTCTVTGCLCFPLYTGTDCSSKILEIAPIFNTTYPQIDVTLSSTHKSKLMLVAFNEIDMNGLVVGKYGLNAWIYSMAPDNIITYRTELFNLDNTITNIILTVEFNNKNITKPISFAELNFDLNPYSLKYSISIDGYPFLKPTNSLEFVFSNVIQDQDTADPSQCSLGQVSSNDLYFTTSRLKVENYVLSTRYINKGLFDGGQYKFVQSVDVSARYKQLSSSHTQQSYFAIVIPHYLNKAIVDPDFTYLYESPVLSTDKGSICHEPLPTNPPQQCLNQCSGNNGQCTAQGCVCIPPWTGLDCSSKIVVITKPPTVNSTNPETTISIPKESQQDQDKPQFYAIISIIGINELDKDGVPINQYPLNNWTIVNKQSQYSQYTNSTYHYTAVIVNKLDQSITTLNVSIDYFDITNPVNITFANEVLTMNPYTLKYSIEISKYTFGSSLNSLQLVVTASLESSDSTCSTVERGDTVESESEFIKMQVNDHSLYGRFIKRGIIDGRVKSVTNTPLDTEYNSIVTSSKSQTFIGINIPYFSNSVELDPDFSVLVDNRPASESSNAICSSQKRSKLTSGQIAGIVVGGVVFLFIVGVVTIYLLSRTGTSKMAVKLRKIVSKQ